MGGITPLGTDFDGCGVYTIKMQLYPCKPAAYASTNLKDWWNNIEMGFTIEREASCEENLANAALFMVGAKEGFLKSEEFKKFAASLFDPDAAPASSDGLKTTLGGSVKGELKSNNLPTIDNVVKIVGG